MFSVLLSQAVLAEGRPTNAALRKAFETNRGSLVEVVGPHRRGTGVVVGSQGQVLTSTRFVGLEAAQVQVDGRALPARVLMANAALKVAVVEIEQSPEVHPPPVALDAPLGRGEWVVGLTRSRSGEITPHVGQVARASDGRSPFFEADLPLPPGSPLFDVRGRLVGISVQARRDSCRAIPLPAVKLELARSDNP